MELWSVGRSGQVSNVQSRHNADRVQEPRVAMESVDTLSLSTTKKSAPKTLKQKISDFVENTMAVRPSKLTYMRYGGLKFIDKVDTSHHKLRDKFHYMDFPAGTKVMTKYGVKEIKENQVAILDFDGKFYIANIKDILDDTSGIISDSGSISSFAQKEAKAKEEARLKHQSRIDRELQDAGINYIGRLNKDNPELKDNVVIEINGERKELDTILYTNDDYKYKNEILRLLQNGKLNDNTILFY